ncbi:hypothetical protein MED297_02137 [Reinekea sp. MED297]|uniref:Uncharacterized protein n=1 Tax=Reinekea blandensis MED297 TaxID=314283 RepID=A4BEF4_9GAMM|nr:hypothetical protein MED297_02137 [Reinekea sp. MED297] [Reinekea blandensis MED297]
MPAYIIYFAFLFSGVFIGLLMGRFVRRR